VEAQSFIVGRKRQLGQRMHPIGIECGKRFITTSSFLSSSL